MTRCAIDLLVIGKEKQSKITLFLSGGNITSENQELFSFSLLRDSLHRYGEVFKFYDGLYFDSIVKKKK